MVIACVPEPACPGLPVTGLGAWPVAAAADRLQEQEGEGENAPLLGAEVNAAITVGHPLYVAGSGAGI